MNGMGFQDAANISPTTNLVGVAIREKSGLRLLKDNTDPKSAIWHFTRIVFICR